VFVKILLGMEKNVGIQPLLQKQLLIALTKNVQMMIHQLQIMPVLPHWQVVLLKELGVLKRLLPVDPIKELFKIVQHSWEVMELNFVGILPQPSRLLLVLKKPVVITRQLLQIKIVMSLFRGLLEPLIQNVWLLVMDVLTIL